MKLNSKHYTEMYQDVYDEENEAGFEKLRKRKRSQASPAWKVNQKQARMMKEIFLNSNI
jgi:hypothetical protein